MLSVMLSTVYWYILSEYDGFGNFMCRFDEIQIPANRTRFGKTLSSEYHTHSAPSLTRRLYSYIISLGVTISVMAGPTSEPLSLNLNQFELVVGYR